MSLIRGSVVLAASAGDYGKMRPNLVIQSDAFRDIPSVTICPLTSDLQADTPAIRIDISPTLENGLHVHSQIAIDKITTLPLLRITAVVGNIDRETMQKVTSAIAVFLAVV